MLSCKDMLWIYLETEINPVYEQYVNKFEVILYFDRDYFEILCGGERYRLFVVYEMDDYFIVVQTPRMNTLQIPFNQKNSFLSIINFIK